MATEFNPKKALIEEIGGLSDVCNTIGVQLRRAQEDHANAELKFNALVKINGFALAELARKREVLADLIDREPK